MKKNTFKLYFVVVLAALNTNASVDYSCASSFDINESKQVKIEGFEFKCGRIDELRLEAYDTLTKLTNKDYIYIEKNIKDTIQNIQDIEKRLKNQSYTDEHINLTVATITKAISYLSLVSCLPSAGAGCSLSLLSSLLSTYGQIDAVGSYAEQAELLKQLRLQLNKKKEELSRHKTAEIQNGYKKALDTFHSLCAAIRKQCSK